MSMKPDFGQLCGIVLASITLLAVPLSAQLLSQSTTAFAAYARPGITPGGSLLSFNEILRQRTEGVEVKQCPCISLPGTNRCISYDSRFQAASLEEAILAFVDTSMNPSLFDDHVGPPLAASAFTCATPACRQCAALLSLRVRQVGISTTLPNFGFPLPDINDLDPSQCRRLRLSRSVPARPPPVQMAAYMTQAIESGLNFLDRTRSNAPRSAFGQAVDAVIALSKQFRGRAFVEAVLGQAGSAAAATSRAGSGDSRSSNSGNSPPGMAPPSPVGPPNGNPGSGNGNGRGSGRPRPRWPTNMPAPVVRPLLRRMQNRNPQQPQRPQQNGQQPGSQVSPPQQGRRPNQFQPQPQGQQFVQSPLPQVNQQQSQQFVPQPQGGFQQGGQSNGQGGFQQGGQGGQGGFQSGGQGGFQHGDQGGFQQGGFQSGGQGNFQPGGQGGFQQGGQFFPQQPPNVFQQAGMIGAQQPLTAGIVHQGVESAISNFVPNPGSFGQAPPSGGGSGSSTGTGGSGGAGGGFSVPGFGNGNSNSGGSGGFGGGFGFGRKKRAADSSKILGNRFIISCVERGDSENEETEYINLCTACWTWRQLPADYFPRLINELVCNENDFCLSGFGACHQRYRNVDVLHRGPNGWQPTTISVAACCDCKVRAGTEGHSLVVGSRGNS
uniref:Uncharacterized protein n=1 Tax=Panagrellus redivivus TaxID=6233 RepID=A0A7E4ZYN4_PANRE